MSVRSFQFPLVRLTELAAICPDKPWQAAATHNPLVIMLKHTQQRIRSIGDPRAYLCVHLVFVYAVRQHHNMQRKTPMIGVAKFRCVEQD